MYRCEEGKCVIDPRRESNTDKYRIVIFFFCARAPCNPYLYGYYIIGNDRKSPKYSRPNRNDDGKKKRIVIS